MGWISNNSEIRTSAELVPENTAKEEIEYVGWIRLREEKIMRISVVAGMRLTDHQKSILRNEYGKGVKKSK